MTSTIDTAAGSTGWESGTRTGEGKSMAESEKPKSSQKECRENILAVARQIDREIGGEALARMPKKCARLIVSLKKWIQEHEEAFDRWHEEALMSYQEPDD